MFIIASVSVVHYKVHVAVFEKISEDRLLTFEWHTVKDE